MIDAPQLDFVRQTKWIKSRNTNPNSVNYFFLKYYIEPLCDQRILTKTEKNLLNSVNRLLTLKIVLYYSNICYMNENENNN